MKKLIVLLSMICMVGAVANANVVSNWGFESGTGTLADNWIQNALDGSTVQRVTETPYAGSFCMKGVINNTTGIREKLKSFSRLLLVQLRQASHTILVSMQRAP